MDWNNVDLSRGSYERGCNVLDPYTFDTLLLEISCNVADINADSVKNQALSTLKAKYEEAIGIVNSNLENLVKQALKDRLY